MKILITTEWYIPTVNGVISSIISLKKSLEKRGHDVRILTLSDKDSHYNEGIYYLPSYGAGKIYPGARFALIADADVLHQIEEWSPDIIHTQCEFSSFRIARLLSQRMNIPIVHTYHTVYEDYTHYFSPSKKWGEKMVAYYSKRVLNNCESVIAPTMKVKHILNSYGVTSPIYEVPTGIDLDRFQRKVPKSDLIQLKKSLLIPEHNNVLVSIGRLAKEKNLEEVLDYLKRLNDPNVTLLIVGDGPHRNALENYVYEAGLQENVVFAGMVTQDMIPSYYQLGDVFVSASTSETQGLSYIEALACGIPALCRKDDCLDKVIIHGENGFQYDDFASFERSFYTLMLHPSFSKGTFNASNNEFFKNYSSDTFGETVESLYQDVLNSRRSARLASI